MLEAQNRVGGRTLTSHFADGTFVDDGGQWVSPGQDCIVGLAEELGVRLFPSWSEGATVHWRAGARTVSKDLFLPEDGNALATTRQAAAALAGMAQSVPPEAPWAAQRAAEWDAVTLHDWLGAHVQPMAARRTLATAIEGVFARNSAPTSLLAALFWIRCGDPLTPFLASDDPGPERRFEGGAQQLSQRMADALDERVMCDAAVTCIDYRRGTVQVWAGNEIFDPRAARDHHHAAGYGRPRARRPAAAGVARPPGAACAHALGHQGALPLSTAILGRRGLVRSDDQ